MIVDAMGATALVVAGVMGIRTWRLLGDDARGATYWLLAGLGMIYLAADEMLDAHERLGRWLWESGVPNPPGVNHLDDVFVLAYALAGLLVTAYYARELLRHPSVLRPFALALGATAVSLAVDARAPVEGVAPYVEELSEFAGTLLFAAAFRRRYLLARAEAGAGVEIAQARTVAADVQMPSAAPVVAPDAD